MQPVDRLIDLFYDGAADAAAWPAAMTQLCDLVGADHAVAMVQGAERTEFPFVTSARVEAGNLAHFVAAAPDGIDLLQPFPERQAFDFDTVIPREVFLRSDFFHEVVRPMGGYWALIAVPFRRNGFDSYLAVCRAPHAIEFGAEEAATIDRVSGHLARAMRTRLAHDEMSLRVAAALGAFDRLSAGVAIVDSELRPVVLNRRAEQIVARGDGLRRSELALVAGSAADAAWLRRMVRQAAADDPRVPGIYTMWLQRPGAEAGWTLTATALATAAGTPRGLVMLFLEEAAPAADLAPMLRTRFALSAREAALAAALAGGSDLATAAQGLGVALGTARTHLKAIFAKTATHRQAELVALLLRLARFGG